MKKLILVLTLAAMLLPMVAAAQNTCCQVQGNIKYDSVTYNDDSWVGEADNTVADGCAQGAPVFAGACVPAAMPGAGGGCTTTRWGMVCVLSTVNKIFNVVFIILVALAGIMIVIGAFTIVTAGGSPDKVTAGRNYILYAMIGLVVALFARAIPAIVMLLV